MKQSFGTGKYNFLKWRKLSALALCTAVLILSHQNCAPAMVGAGPAAIGGLSNGGGAPVSIIDNNKAGMELSFSVAQLQVSSSSSAISFQGNCSTSQEDAVLGWKLAQASGSQVTSGLATCSGGHFTVSLAAAQGLVCGATYQVVAQLGAGDPTQISVVRRCAPLATFDASSVRSLLTAPAQDTCALESSSSGCAAVCYSSNGTVDAQQSMDASFCASH